MNAYCVAMLKPVISQLVAAVPVTIGKPGAEPVCSAIVSDQAASQREANETGKTVARVQLVIALLPSAGADHERVSVVDPRLDTVGAGET